MQAYRKGEDYFSNACCTHLRQHGFMSKWTEQDCTEFVQEVRERINRRDQDPGKEEFETRKHRYGNDPSPPSVSRNVNNQPSWKTNPGLGYDRAGH